jgi:serine/threonine-protein kinase
VLGEYELGASYVRRAVADVYDATHQPTGGARRVYVLRPGAMQDSPLVHRVVCEADAARWIRHPAAARLEAQGDTPSRRLFVAVELPPGRPLGVVLAEAGRLAPCRVVRLAGRLVEALDEAHAVGLVHGRLTPASVIVADDVPGAESGTTPTVWLAGLGTGALDGADPLAEAERPYVSPEQRSGAEADVRSDVFGLASLLHHALTGDVPAEDLDTDTGATDRDRTDAAVQAVLAAARAAEPRRRPATIKAFWEDLLEALVADVARATHPSEPDLASAALASAAIGLGSDAAAAFADLELADFDPPLPPAPAPTPEPDGAAPTHFSGVDLSPVRAFTAPAREPRASRVAEGRPVEPRALEPRAAESRLAPSSRLARRAADAAPARSRRGVSAVLVHAWWLAVPAVAAALGWPIARDTDDAPVRPAPTYAGRQRITAPPLLDTVTVASDAATRLGGARARRRDADASGVADDPATPVPTAPHVEMPTIYFLAAPEPVPAAAAARPLVHPDEFSTRIKIPGAPQ